MQVCIEHCTLHAVLQASGEAYGAALFYFNEAEWPGGYKCRFQV